MKPTNDYEAYILAIRLARLTSDSELTKEQLELQQKKRHKNV